MATQVKIQHQEFFMSMKWQAFSKEAQKLV